MSSFLSLFSSLLALSIVYNSSAHAEPTTSATASNTTSTRNVDCSNAGSGKILINTSGEILTQEVAATLAYSCLAQKNRNVVSARKLAIKEAKKNDLGEPGNCGASEALQTLVLTSWNSGRPSTSVVGDGQIIVGITSGEATVLIREPLVCGPMGTGLFEGTVNSVSAVIEVKNSATFNMTDESVPATQRIELKLKRIINLN